MGKDIIIIPPRSWLVLLNVVLIFDSLSFCCCCFFAEDEYVLWLLYLDFSSVVQYLAILLLENERFPVSVGNQ